MKDSTPLILGGLLLVAGIGIAKSLSARCVPNIKAGSRVFLVGDSLAVGLGPYVKKLCTSVGADFDAASQISTTTGFWVGNAEFKAQIAAFQPTIVLVSLGTNDTAGNTQAPQLSANIAAMIDIIRATGAIVYWILPPTLPFADRFSALVRQTGVPVFESSRFAIPRGPDNLHPTGLGYASWAGVIWQTATCSKEPPAVSLSGLGRLRFLPLNGVRPRASGVMSRVAPARPVRRRKPTITFRRT
ncbi:MAG: SGNH/GDSL hydrolase family protein [bacterium]